MRSVMIYLFFLFLIAASCKRNNGPDYLSGTILIEAATRGSYQYLIRIDGQSYFPENLPQEYQNPNIQHRPILVRFELTGETQEIYVPAPNDVPIYGYTVQVVRILSIKDP